MHFCNYCGRQLSAGEVCNCPASAGAGNSGAYQGQQSQSNAYGQQGLYPQQSPYGQPGPYSQPGPYAPHPGPYAPHGYGQAPGPYPQPQPRVKQPGKGIIKATGIIMTVFSSLGVLMWLIIFFVISVATGFHDIFQYEFMEQIGIFLLFSAGLTVITLAFGIAGIIMASNQKRGFVVLGLGAGLLILNIVSAVWSFGLMSELGRHIGDFGGYYGSYYDSDLFAFQGVMATSTWSGLFINSILPILYIVGGIIRGRSKV